ncbi:MAG: carbonic anhydrase [Pseudomonadota bacterium]
MTNTTAPPSKAVLLPEHLFRGYRRFRQARYAEEAALFRELAEGQSPRTMIIGCADSRVDPATIFAAAPGELFVVRNVGAIVPPCDLHHPETGSFHGTSAALEFAVTVLGVSEIVVMGHGSCGGVAAALAAENAPQGRFIGPWVDLLAPARDQLRACGEHLSASERQRTLEHLAVEQSLRHLTTFPFVTDAIDAGRLELHGAWFSIAEGELHWLDKESGDFMPVNAS